MASNPATLRADAEIDFDQLVPVHPHLVAEARCGAWIAPDGKLYPVLRGTHVAVARRLRVQGNGPDRDWTIAKPWVTLLANGQVVGLRLTHAQWGTLVDLWAAAKRGGPECRIYAANLVESMREIDRTVTGNLVKFGCGVCEDTLRLVRPAHEGD
jgi:hypothetical protein